MKSASSFCSPLLCIGSLLLGAAPLSAQSVLQPQRTSAFFSSSVSYTSPDGQGAPKFPNIDLVFDLRQPTGMPILPHPEELALYSEGKQVGVCTGLRTFDRTGYGTSTVIALDAAGALRTLTPTAINLAVFTIVHDGVKQDTTAVTSIAEDFFVDLPFHPGPRKWPAHSALFPARGTATHLYDGLMQATSLFNASLPRRRILLAIVNGPDGGSTHTPLELLARAKSLGVEINVVGVDPNANAGEQIPSSPQLAILQQVSLATGGTYTTARNGDELQQLIALHLSRVRATQVGEFQLSHLPADGQVHALQLRWITGNQSTPAFLTAPAAAAALSMSALLANPLFHNPWLLGFGSCFLIGLCLLLLTLTPSRTPKPTPQPQPSAADIFFKPPSGPYPASPSGTPPSLNSGRLPQPQHPVEAATRPDQRGSAPGPSPGLDRFDAPPQGPFARLVLRNEAQAGKIIPMTQPVFSIGTLPGNNLALAGDLTISGSHLRFYWENAILYVEDNHSTNGTWLNRQRLPEGRHQIKPGDEIGLGQTYLIIERA